MFNKLDDKRHAKGNKKSKSEILILKRPHKRQHFGTKKVIIHGQEQVIQELKPNPGQYRGPIANPLPQQPEPILPQNNEQERPFLLIDFAVVEHDVVVVEDEGVVAQEGKAED